jgi:hypothetical protein
MISRVQGDRGYPHNVWSMTDEGAPLEAQLENAATGDYHGYPLPPDDPMHAIVIREWAQRVDQGADDA